MKLKVITPTSKESSVEVSAVVFGQKANPVLLAQAIRVYLANLRQGTSKVKTRAKVNRTKAKWYRQKGTGGARHGARSAPIFVGGGVAHGPTGLQNWQLSMNRKMKAQALRVALSMQADKVVVTDNLNGLKGKTAEAAAILHKMLGDFGRTVIVLPSDAQSLYRSVRNIDGVLAVPALELTALQVALADTIVLTKESLQVLETRLSKEKKVAAKVSSVEPKKAAAPATKKAPVKKAAAKSAAKPAAKKSKGAK